MGGFCFLRGGALRCVSGVERGLIPRCIILDSRSILGSFGQFGFSKMLEEYVEIDL